jgi:hypothetical protein
MNRDSSLSLKTIGDAFGDTGSYSLSEYYHANPYYTDAPDSGSISIGDIKNTSAGIQYGQIGVEYNVSESVTFSGAFSDIPCVFFTHEHAGGKTDTPYLESVSATGFNIRSMRPGVSVIHWIAVLPNYPGTDTYGGLKYSCERGLISNGAIFNFTFPNPGFTSVPVILCNIQDDSAGTGVNAFHVRWSNSSLTTTGVEIRTETMATNYEALPISGSNVGLLAIEQGTGTNPFIKTVISPDTVTHASAYTLNLGLSYPEITTIANCTVDGGDTSQVAMKDKTDSSMTFTVQECATNDGSHTTETVSIVALGRLCPLYNYPYTPATGGTITTDGVYNIHAFTSVGTTTFTVPGVRVCDILIVAGGGGGGGSAGGGASGAGGGAGGLILDLDRVITSGSYSIVVGGGGTAGGRSSDTPGGNGESSSAFSLIANGGGGGGCRAASNDANANGRNGGSGGGEGSQGVTTSYGSGTSGQGNNGGLDGFSGTTSNNNASGGGGGAGGVGGDGLDDNYSGNGGIGLDMSSYFTTAFGDAGWFAGGGGGGTPGSISNQQGTGGQGGGGDGGNNESNDRAGAGVANTGGGGGGAGGNEHPNVGGSGIVLIRYRIST